MIKSGAARILSRRLNLNAGRVSALLVVASDAGLLPKGSGRYAPALSYAELAYLILACITDVGIGSAGTSAKRFGALESAEGLVLFDLVEAWTSARASVTGLQNMIVQIEPAGVTVTTSGHHFRFGAESAGGSAKQILIRGSELAAAILEFQGMSPDEADNAIAVGRLAAALH